MKNNIIGAINIMKELKVKPNYASTAREYGLDWRTVKKLYENTSTDKVTKHKKSKLDPFKNEIMSKLTISRISIEGLHFYLIEKYGQDNIGSCSNLRTYVNKNRLKPKSKNTIHPRYETNYGELAQVDWKENISMKSRNGEIFNFNIFHYVLKCSRYSYIELSLLKQRTDVKRCLINSFKFMGGTAKRVLFDNMSTVVDVKTKRINNEIIQMGKDFSFKPEKCKSRTPQTKGCVEARNKPLDYIRLYDNDFEDLDELIYIVEKINHKINSEICQGTNIPPSVIFYKEKEYLEKLPCEKIINSNLKLPTTKVDNAALINYKGSKYSVPKEFINKMISYDQFENQLLLYYNRKLITMHIISSNNINYHQKHYNEVMKDKVKESDLESFVTSNLSIMDSFLNQDNNMFVISLKEAIKDEIAFNAYMCSSKQTSWVKRYFVTLNAQDREILFNKMKIVEPFIISEKSFVINLKFLLKDSSISNFIIQILIWDSTDGNELLLSSEGYDFLSNKYKKQFDKHFENMSKYFIQQYKER